MGEGAGVTRSVVGVGIAAVLAAATLVSAAPAPAEALSPWWGVTSGSEPTNLVSGGHGQIVVTAGNRGDADTAGEVTISDRLPVGLQATGIESSRGGKPNNSRGPVSCVLATLTCTYSGSLRPFEQIEVDISVSIGARAASGEQNTASVSGGGVSSAVSASHAIEVDGSEKSGVEDFHLIAENAGGSVDTRAGSHPFQLTSVVTLNTAPPEREGYPQAVTLPRDIVSELPAGLIADPAPLERCTERQFDKYTEGPGLDGNQCPTQSAVGAATVTFDAPPKGFATVTTPIFNVEALPGEPARFGISLLGVASAFLKTSVRSGGDYGVTLASNSITQMASLLSLKLTFWGVPGDPRHDGQRGWECLVGSGGCTPSAAISSLPFLSLPTSCGTLLLSAFVGDSWPQANELQANGLAPVLYPLASATLPALNGCGSLPFSPEISTSLDTNVASTPSGFGVHVHVSQAGGEGSEAVASSPVKDMTIALPAGVTLNPAGANGLEACSERLIGFEGSRELPTEPGVSNPVFTPYLPGTAAALAAGDGEPMRPGMNFCPDASKIGTVKISTPLLANPLEGAMYLASPQNLPGGPRENPFGSLVAVYVVAEEPISGVLVKLPGKLALDSVTGQLTATFEDTPQLPFEDIDLQFFGGAQAPLSTPARCGTYTTNAPFVPWAAEESDQSALTRTATSTFAISSGPNGSPCRYQGQALLFSPSMTAGTASIQAGAFSPLTVTIGRADGQQAIQSMRLKLPPGLSGMLAGVPLCPEAQANAGACGSASEIGETTLLAGLGGDPLTIAGGKVYLTEGYEGAPFGLSIAVPARVGPFDLQEVQADHRPRQARNRPGDGRADDRDRIDSPDS